MVKQFLIFWLLTTVCTFLSAQSILLGKVTDAINHEPLPFVNAILSKNGVPKLSVQSDFDGQYRLVVMEAGIYDIEFSLISYQKWQRQQVHLIDNQSISLDIELKDDTAAAYSIRVGKIPMVYVSNTSMIMGRVTMDGEPLQFVNVLLLQSGMQVAQEVTDGDGLYRIPDLNAGNYDIDFSHIGFQKTHLSNLKLIDNQCFTAHAEIKGDSTSRDGFGLGPTLIVKPLDSLQRLKSLDLPKSIKHFGCGVTSGGHSALFYISSCQIQVNPADTIAYAETPMPIQSLQITNAQGQEMLYRTHLPAGTQKIKVSKWANGVYDALFKEGAYVFKASFSIIR